jgi:aspartate aminotransferase-like enzyme
MYLHAPEAYYPGVSGYTPAVGIWFGLREALRLLGAEGGEKVFLRHRLLGEAVRAGLLALGFRLLAREETASPVVTAAYPPEGVEASALIRLLKERFGVVVAGGQDELQGLIIRVAHMGAVRWPHIERFFRALEAVLGELGRGERGGLEAAEEVLRRQEKASLTAFS